MRTRFGLLLLLGVGCNGDKTSPGDKGGTGGDETAAPDSGDSGGDDTDTTSLLDDYVVTELDQTTYAMQGYEVATFELAPDADDPYPSLLEGYTPTFYVVRPMEIGEAPLNTMLWFHGGALGDDSSGELPRGCQAEQVIDYATRTITSDFLPLTMSMSQGWAMVLPRNDWCDYWTGLGPTDPVDPERHYGYYHTARMLDFVRAGGAGWTPDRLFSWGTSAGGGAAIHVPARYDADLFEGVISDSAPSSMLLYYNTDPQAIGHIFGGGPTDSPEVAARYQQASAETLISELGLELPIYVTWNVKDTLVGVAQPLSLIKAMEDHYAPAGVNHGAHDYNHRSPGDQYHTQSKWPHVPWGYTGDAMFRFLDGADITWVEAEDACGGPLAKSCVLGAVRTEDDPLDKEEGPPAPSVIDFSGGAVIETLPAEGEGVAMVMAIPESIPPGETDAVLVVEAFELQGLKLDTAVGVLIFTEGERRAERTLYVRDFVPSGGGSTNQFLIQYARTRISMRNPTSSGRITYQSLGVARVLLDAVIFITDPASGDGGGGR